MLGRYKAVLQGASLGADKLIALGDMFRVLRSNRAAILDPPDRW